MSKRKSDNRSKNTGPWTPENRNQIIDRMIEIAGALPSGSFPIYERPKGEVITRPGTAREALHQAIQHAHMEYMLVDERRWRRDNKQYQDALRQIGTTAKRLLSLVQDVDDYELRRAARKEAASLHSALGELELHLFGRSNGLLSGEGRIRIAMAAVDSLGRWAMTAIESHAHRARARGSLEPTPTRHRGDVSLNRYIQVIVEGCWCDVWGHKVADGPKLWSFVTLAASGVAVPLTRDASRERIRRVFNLRRANRIGAGRDLPSRRKQADQASTIQGP